MDNLELHYLKSIQQQIDAHEEILQYLWEIDAMLEPLLAGNLLEFPIVKLHTYLCIISNLVEKATKLNESLIKLLNKVKKGNALV